MYTVTLAWGKTAIFTYVWRLLYPPLIPGRAREWTPALRQISPRSVSTKYILWPLEAKTVNLTNFTKFVEGLQYQPLGRSEPDLVRWSIGLRSMLICQVSYESAYFVAREGRKKFGRVSTSAFDGGAT